MSNHRPEQPNLTDIRGTGITLDDNHRWGPYREGSSSNTRCHVYVVTSNPFGFPFDKKFIVGIRVNGPVRFISSLPDEWHDYINYERDNLKPVKLKYRYEWDWENAMKEWENGYKYSKEIVEDYFAAIVKKYC